MNSQIREPSFEAIKTIASEHQAAKFRYGSNRKTVLIDAFTASAIVAVHGAANADNQAKLERMIAGTPEQLSRMAAFCLSKAH